MSGPVDPEDMRTWPQAHQGALCQCGNLPKQWFVKKEGPNHGKEFYGCAGPKGETCKFWKWGDEYRGTASAPRRFGGPAPAKRQESSAEISEVKAMLLGMQDMQMKILQTVQSIKCCMEEDEQHSEQSPSRKRNKN